jgi:hypothetical protein
MPFVTALSVVISTLSPLVANQALAVERAR